MSNNEVNRTGQDGEKGEVNGTRGKATHDYEMKLWEISSIHSIYKRERQTTCQKS